MTLSPLDSKLLGLLVLSCLGALYFYFYYDIVEDSELRWINGTIKEVPYEGSDGGDFSYKFIRLRLIEYPNEFYIQGCSYRELSLDKTLKLKVGDPLKMGFKGALAGDIDAYVFELYSGESVQLLSLEDYNSCSRSEWKMTYYLALVIGLVLVVRYGRKYIRGEQ